MGNDSKKTAVLLLAFGGADSVENVGQFVKNILSPREPGEALINDAIERYRLIGGSSPLLRLTNAQADMLEARLHRDGYSDVDVYVGMLNWDPYIKDTVKKMKADGVEKIVAVIMAPHTSKVATGKYNIALEEAAAEAGGMEVEYVRSWHTDYHYIEAVKEYMQTSFSQFVTLREKEKLLVIFSAHSLPAKAVERDDYVKKIEETIEYITERLHVNNRLAYQSMGRGGDVEWLGPSTEDVIEEAAKDGMVGVTVVPISFVADNVETLFDIDILFKDKAKALGMDFSRAPALNSSDKFIKALQVVIGESLDA